MLIQLISATAPSWPAVPVQGSRSTLEARKPLIRLCSSISSKVRISRFDMWGDTCPGPHGTHDHEILTTKHSPKLDWTYIKRSGSRSEQKISSEETWEVTQKSDTLIAALEEVKTKELDKTTSTDMTCFPVWRSPNPHFVKDCGGVHQLRAGDGGGQDPCRGNVTHTRQPGQQGRGSWDHYIE